MRLLILGGPRFVGRHLIEAALARGHRVTMFNRGRTEPELFPEVEKLRGDRATDLSGLEAGRWDAAIDTSGFLPDVVRRSADRLSGRVGHYVFVSSVSVYADFSHPGMDEGAPLATMTPEQREKVPTIDASQPMSTPAFLELYGALKVECERVIESAFAGRCAITRPGLIVGPHDYMDRFPYWVSRIAEGGEVLAPGRPARPVQIIDARDLADWMVVLAERRVSGTFNATGPGRTLTMTEMLEACRTAAASDARFVWVDEAFLAERKVGMWEELPMWVHETTSTAHLGILQMDVRRAIASGLTFRPVVETVRDTLAWERTRGSHPWRSGLARDKERALLEEWKQTARV
jgi:2'-hydroxyisoflavone reductase